MELHTGGSRVVAVRLANSLYAELRDPTGVPRNQDWFNLH